MVKIMPDYVVDAIYKAFYKHRLYSMEDQKRGIFEVLVGDVQPLSNKITEENIKELKDLLLNYQRQYNEIERVYAKMKDKYSTKYIISIGEFLIGLDKTED